MLNAPDLHVLRLAGDSYEMGYAHGRYAKEHNALSALLYYCDFIDAILTFQPTDAIDRWLREKLRFFISNTVERNLESMIPERYRYMIEGFSDASGIGRAHLIKGFLMPDVYAYVLSYRYRWFRPKDFEFMNLGCTSFVKIDEAKEGSLLHGRNLDYPGGRTWNEYPSVVEYAPKNGQRYAAISSVGIESAGVTSINESGISLSLHMNYSKRSQSTGTPIVFIGHEMIRRSHTLAQAIHICREFPKTAGWSFLISSAKEKKAATIQFDAADCAVQFNAHSTTVLTNHFMHPMFKPYEYWVSPGRCIDTHARMTRAKAIIESSGEIFGVEKMRNVLADSIDPALSKERAFGSTICQVHTVTSVVFDAMNRRVHVASGDSPVPKNAFRTVDLFPGPRVEDANPANNKAIDSRHFYALAYDAYFPASSLQLVASQLERAIQINSTEPLYFRMLGATLLKQGQLAKAQKQFELAISLDDHDYGKNLTRFLYAKTLDALKLRQQALQQYGGLASHAYFGKRIKKYVRRACRKESFASIILDFTLGDVIER